MKQLWLPKAALATLLICQLATLPDEVLAKGGHHGGGKHGGGKHGGKSGGSKHDGGHQGAFGKADAGKHSGERRHDVVAHGRGRRMGRRGWRRGGWYGPGGTTYYNNQQIIELQKKKQPPPGETAFSRPYNAPPSYDKSK